MRSRLAPASHYGQIALDQRNAIFSWQDKPVLTTIYGIGGGLCTRGLIDYRQIRDSNNSLGQACQAFRSSTGELRSI